MLKYKIPQIVTLIQINVEEIMISAEPKGGQPIASLATN